MPKVRQLGVFKSDDNAQALNYKTISEKHDKMLHKIHNKT